ncbi:MAG: hypothetical protein AAFZ15_02585 [Bacteroidota bacterium]
MNTKTNRLRLRRYRRAQRPQNRKAGVAPQWRFILKMMWRLFLLLFEVYG